MYNKCHNYDTGVETMTSVRLGKVRITKDQCVDNEGMRSVMKDVTFEHEGKTYTNEVFSHWEGGKWLKAGQVCEVISLTTKGVRVRTGFDTPNKATYVHHENFSWVEDPEGAEHWAILPSELY